MIPQFILDTCAHKGRDVDGDLVYWFSTREQDGWVIYYPSLNDTHHTYRDPSNMFMEDLTTAVI